MRLTLRTLLAYLDDILEPAQAKEIGAKISESSFASTLISRIQDVLRRRRLMAPELNDTTDGLDINKVAEYLDNSMSPEYVADVERICLESDVHLAEVAACHQILTLVLGEPIDVDPDTRKKMHKLVESLSHATYSTDQSGEIEVNSKKVVAPQSITQTKPEALPNYPVDSANDFLTQATLNDKPAPEESDVKTILSTEPSFWKRASQIGIISLALVIWICLILFDESLFPKTGAPATGTDPGVAAVGKDGNGDNAGRRLIVGQPKPMEEGNLPEVAGDAANKGVDPLRSPDKSTTPLPAEAPDDDEPITADVEVTVVAPPVEPTAVVEPGPVGEPMPKPITPAEEVTTTEPTGEAPVIVKPDLTPIPASAKPLAPALPLAYVSQEDGLLLHYSIPKDGWFVDPAKVDILSGEWIANVEPFESTINIDGGRGQIVMRGGSVLRNRGPSPDTPVGLEVPQGRFVFTLPLATSVKADDPLAIELTAYGIAYIIELQSAGTVCGIEIYPRQPDQLEQDLTQDRFTAGLYVSTGSVRLKNRTSEGLLLEGKPLTLDSGTAPAAGGIPSPCVYVPFNQSSQLDELAQKAESLPGTPAWLSTEDSKLPLSAQRYATLYQREFQKEELLSRYLPGLVKSPQPRIAELAVRTLALLGDYQSMVNALVSAPAGHEEARRAAINGLRYWLPQAPPNRELLQEALKTRMTENDATTTYQLLWGFSEAEARDMDSSLALIVKLDSEQIAIRSLAYYYLTNYTDRRLEYRPSLAPSQRRSAVQRLATQVEKDKGLIRNK